MLTPTDIHLLVGLLTQISRPDSVDIILGDMIFDSVAEENRDVDVTVRAISNTGMTTSFEGIEVKHHKRPLDTTHIEQLCAKLNDMPEITVRGIVSGSGYTKPAVRKASQKNVDLFELRDWPDPKKLGHIKLSEKLVIGERKYQWVGTPHISLISSINKPTDKNYQFEMSAPIINRKGAPNTTTPTCEVLVRSLISRATNLAEEQGKSLNIAPGETKPLTFNISLENELFTIVGGEQIPLARAVITGDLHYSEIKYSPEYKGLFRYGETQPYIGCAIFEMEMGNLAGYTVDPTNNLRFINISIDSRLLGKIYRKPLH